MMREVFGNAFTDHAREVVSFAIRRAEQKNHRAVRLEDLLLGLARSSGIAHEFLKDSGLGVYTVRRKIKELHTDQPSSSQIHIHASVDERAKCQAYRALEEAGLWANKLQHHYIGTEHILLSILHISDKYAKSATKNGGDSEIRCVSKILADAGITEEKFLEESGWSGFLPKDTTE